MMKQLIFKLKDIVNRLFLLVVKFFIYMCVSTMKYNGLLYYYASVTVTYSQKCYSARITSNKTPSSFNITLNDGLNNPIKENVIII